MKGDVMTKRVPFFSLMVFAFLMLPVFAYAEPAASPEPAEMVSGILTAFTGKKWAILVGFVLTGLVYVVRTYFLASWKWAQTRRGGAIVAIGIAVIGTLGAELAAGVLSVGTILDAVMAAIMSAGGYNLFTRIFLPVKTEQPPAASSP
jgi:hypothetical protein